MPRGSRLPPYVHGDGRSLGSELRAARMGFRWLSGAQRYVRVREMFLPGGRGSCWRIEAVRPGNLPVTRGPALERNLRAWWEVDSTLAALTEIVSTVALDSPSITFHVDDDGKRVDP